MCCSICPTSCLPSSIPRPPGAAASPKDLVDFELLIKIILFKYRLLWEPRLNHWLLRDYLLLCIKHLVIRSVIFKIHTNILLLEDDLIVNEYYWYYWYTIHTVHQWLMEAFTRKMSKNMTMTKPFLHTVQYTNDLINHIQDLFSRPSLSENIVSVVQIVYNFCWQLGILNCLLH